METYIKEANEIVNKAGEVIKKAFYENKKVELKAGFADLVTETDKAVEVLIFNHLKSKFKDHCYVGEESFEGNIQLTDAPTWVLDPIDGTTNFVHSYPCCAISLGLLVKKEIQYAIVFNPITTEKFTAQKDKGAFLDGKKIHVSSVKDMSQASAICEFGSDRNDDVLAKKLKTLSKIVKLVHGIRSLGSAALDLCYVACGRCDMYCEFGPHIWDFCAGALIVTEAGGVVTSTDGSPLDLLNRRILATSSKELASQIIKHVDQIDLPRD